MSSDAPAPLDGPLHTWRRRWLDRRGAAPTMSEIAELAALADRPDGSDVSCECVGTGSLASGFRRRPTA